MANKKVHFIVDRWGGQRKVTLDVDSGCAAGNAEPSKLQRLAAACAATSHWNRKRLALRTQACYGQSVSAQLRIGQERKNEENGLSLHLVCHVHYWMRDTPSGIT